MLNDANFIKQFEQLTLPPEQFSHTGHIRLAWLYLSNNKREEAIEKAKRGIKAYAESLGAKDKYHTTITHYLVKEIADRQALQPAESWQSFITQNGDLELDAISVLLQYFSKHRLFSDKARVELIKPDKKDCG